MSSQYDILTDVRTSSLIHFLSSHNDPDLLSAFFPRVFHDLASPLNTLTLSIDTLETSYDQEMLGYAKNSAIEATSLLLFFRFLTNSSSDTCGKNELEKLLKNISRQIRVIFEKDSFPTWLGQIIGCSMYAIPANKDLQGVCTILQSGKDYQLHLDIRTKSTNSIFADTEQVTPRSIFQHITMRYAQKLDLSLSVKRFEESISLLFAPRIML